MKVYLYNTENGAYLGEDFSARAAGTDNDGETSVAPPPYGAGEIPVFDPGALCWRVMSADRMLARVKKGR